MGYNKTRVSITQETQLHAVTITIYMIYTIQFQGRVHNRLYRE